MSYWTMYHGKLRREILQSEPIVILDSFSKDIVDFILDFILDCWVLIVRCIMVSWGASIHNVYSEVSNEVENEV